DDGMLHCLDHAGKRLWSFRGGPVRRLVIGHDRLISAWPVSARPVLAAGKVFAVFGYWPLDGVSVHPLDAETGKSVWKTAINFRPKGALSIVENTLFLDGHEGSAHFDLRTGARVSKPVPSGYKLHSTSTRRDLIFTCTKEGKLTCFGPS